MAERQFRLWQQSRGGNGSEDICLDNLGIRFIFYDKEGL